MIMESYCQSCGMPMGKTDEMKGTDADGSVSTEYCKYCYSDGKFMSECSLEEMVDICVPHMVANNEKMTEDTARKELNQFFPTLKRWKK